jgi:hypothetical protein
MPSGQFGAAFGGKEGLNGNSVHPAADGLYISHVKRIAIASREVTALGERPGQWLVEFAGEFTALTNGTRGAGGLAIMSILMIDI